MSDTDHIMAAERPRKQVRHDRNAVLDLWADGRTAGEIAARLNIAASAASNIVREERLRGDKRAHKRNRGPTVRRVGYLPHGLVPIANREARAHGMSVSDLCIRIISAVFRDGLVNAVLDDDPPTPGSSAKNTPSIDAISHEHRKSPFSSTKRSTACLAKSSTVHGQIIQEEVPA